jgi:hypothetical protein
LKWLALVLIAVCLVAGCGGGGKKIPVTQLPSLVLQPQDVTGFVRLDFGPLGIVDTHPGARENPSRFGRKGGWKARYRGLRRLTVTSTADLFGSEDGAKQDFDAYNVQFQQEIVDSDGEESFISVPKIGAGSLAVTIASGGVRTSTIAWRYANVTASIELAGPSGLVANDRLIRFARRQERRIEAAAAKRQR